MSKSVPTPVAMKLSNPEFCRDIVVRTNHQVIYSLKEVTQHAILLVRKSWCTCKAFEFFSNEENKSNQ